MSSIHFIKVLKTLWSYVSKKVEIIAKWKSTKLKPHDLQILINVYDISICYETTGWKWPIL